LARRWLGGVPALVLASLALLPLRAQAVDHTGQWSFGASGGFATASAHDVNQRLDFDNLSFASAIPHIDSFHEAGGDLRYDVDRRLAFEGRVGYWWKNQSNGRFDRKVSAIPAALGVVWRPFTSDRWRIGGTAAGGVVIGAKLSGQDPLGGIDFSGTGGLAEGGVTVELALSQSVSLEARGVGRWAVAKNVLPDGGDVNLSGVSGRAGLRFYFRARRPAAPTPGVSAP